jgi:CTP synthase (UTP-ammonia lyase)
MICRSIDKVGLEFIEKINLFCDVDKVIFLKNCNVLWVPKIIFNEGILDYLCKMLMLDVRKEKK